MPMMPITAASDSANRGTMLPARSAASRRAAGSDRFVAGVDRTFASRAEFERAWIVFSSRKNRGKKIS